MTTRTTQDEFKRGAADAGRYFDFMTRFVDFRPEYGDAIRATRHVVENHLPGIVADFYAHVLSFPATRKHFLKKDGTIDREYIEFRMQHQAAFWRRTAQAVFDEDYARFLDYIGRAHTSRGADPAIYVSERYVLGMVGFVQQRIAQALATELGTSDPTMALAATKGWNALLMVLLEMLSRAYGEGREAETFQAPEELNDEPLQQLAAETLSRSMDIQQAVNLREVHVGSETEFTGGGRKIVDAEGLSIGVFLVDGQWHALHNSCLHRGGPICQGSLENGILTCPWHGYEYRLATGELLLDPSAKVPRFAVTTREGEVYVHVPVLARSEVELSMEELFIRAEAKAALATNEFRTSELMSGQMKLLTVDGADVVVYNVGGCFYATQNECTHADGPLCEGVLEGVQIVCPWHDSGFDVTTGAVLVGPATEPLRTYKVVVEGEVGRVE